MGRRYPPSSHPAIVLLAAIPAILLWVFLGWFALLAHRMSGDVMARHWKTPTEIYSSTDDEEPIAKVFGSDWRRSTPVELGDLPGHVPNAFLAAEDVRFRSHVGIDPIGIARALLTNVRAGGIRQGGSTINQQLIKGRYFSNERSFRRKVSEAMLAVLLDFRMSKDEILEAYLNDVYLGHVNGRAVKGIDEASRLFYDKRPQKLTVAEAALIASIIRAPNRDTPGRRPEVARARRDTVLATMLEREWITEEEHGKAVDSPARFRKGSLPADEYPYYIAALRSEFASKVGARALNRPGLKIVAEIDPRMQKAAEEAARRGSASLRSRYGWLRTQHRQEPLQTAVIALDPETGGIRALVGGADYAQTHFDRTSRMRRQAGSAFKTFAYTTAISRRKATPATLLLDAPVTVKLASNRQWEPRNYDERFRGRVTVREAFEKSLNVPAVRLTQDVGERNVVRLASKLGFEKVEPVPSLPLGVTGVSPRQLAAAYTIFPNGGEVAEPFLLRRVTNSKGKVVFEHEPKRKSVVDPASAYVMHSLLRGVVRRGTASRLSSYGLGHAAGKTGTTNDYRDAWFVGYTADVVTAVWVGFDSGAPLRLSSAEAAIPIWGAMMRDVKTSRKELEPPDGVEFRKIDPESGLLWREGCPGPIEEVFLEGTAPKNYCPRGFAGRIIRKVLFDDETFDEPAAITFDKFRRWAFEAEQNRRQVEEAIDRIERVFNGDPPRAEQKRPEKGKGKGKGREGSKGKGKGKGRD
jgi:penicillin-binding protein 1B